MSFFKNLFGKNKPAENSGSGITVEQFRGSADIQELLKAHGKASIVIHLKKSAKPIDLTESKFGGIPNGIGFQQYPHCPSCSTPLNFVLQFYKKDFPQFYFAEDKDLFQLFRCPNYDCADASNEKYDLPTLHFYFCAKDLTKEHHNPGHNLKEAEASVPDCTIHPESTIDYPNFDDYEDGKLDFIATKYGEEWSDQFIDDYDAIPHTKIGGYPSFTQYPHYPSCSCGKTKEFFFQLASDDSTEEKKFPNVEWSPHGIMIGDVGNIYFFVCRSCGPETIETYWDCC